MDPEAKELRSQTTLTMLAFDIRWSSDVCFNGLARYGQFADSLALITGQTLEGLFDTLPDYIKPRAGEIEINKFLGDGFLILFHGESDKANARAVHASLGLMNKFKGLVATTGLPHLGMKCALRGEVLYGQVGTPVRYEHVKVTMNSFVTSEYRGMATEHTALGHHVIKTFRILEKAKKGQVLASDEVWRSVRGDFFMANMDPIILKGEFVPDDKIRWIFSPKPHGIFVECSDECVHHPTCMAARDRGSQLHAKNSKSGSILQYCLYNSGRDACPGCQQRNACQTVHIMGEQGKNAECCDRCVHWAYCQFNFLRTKNRAPDYGDVSLVYQATCPYTEKK